MTGVEFAYFADAPASRSAQAFLEIALSLREDLGGLEAVPQRQWPLLVDLMHLPVDLNILCIEYTSLSGTLDLSALPRKLDQLFFTHNAITSVKDLVNIPETLRYFAVNEGNVVENSIVIGKKHMEELTISFDGCGFKNVTFVEGQENDGESFLF